MPRAARTVITTAIGGLVVMLVSGAGAPGGSVLSASASGSLGEVDVIVDGERIVQDPIAPCETEGEESNSSGEVEVDEVATYGGGQTQCDKGDQARAEVTGDDFATDVLREWGGPRISLSGFAAHCETRDNGSAGGVQLRGIRGIEVPEDIPPNHTVTIPGRIEGAAPLAEVVVNEVITPEPADGSMTVHVMRIELFPEGGGPNSGDIIVGTAACDPFGR